MKQRSTPSHLSQLPIINPDSFFGLTSDAQQALLEKKITSEKERKQFIQGELFDLFLNHIGLHTSRDGLITFISNTIDTSITELNSGIYVMNTKIANFSHSYGMITMIQKNIEEHLKNRLKESGLPLSPTEINALSIETGAVLLYLEPIEGRPAYYRLTVEIPHFNVTYIPNERSQPQILIQGSAVGHGKNAIDIIKRQSSDQIPTTKLIIKT